jgi:hypothetical protein
MMMAIPRFLIGSFSIERAMKNALEFVESIPDDMLTEEEQLQRQVAVDDLETMLAALDDC